MIVSIETMVGLGFHVLSGHYYSAFAGTACTYFILHNIIALQLGMYVAIRHGFFKYYFSFNN